MLKCELYNDHFQNYKMYGIPKAQLVIADIPYNLGNKAYASNPQWYKDGDNKNGESELAGKEFFDTDKDFRIKEFFHIKIKQIDKETIKRYTNVHSVIYDESIGQLKISCANKNSNYYGTGTYNHILCYEIIKISKVEE